MDNSHPNKHASGHNSHAYLVRLWRDSPDEPWRATAKLVADGRELHFANPEKLFLFLHEQTLSKSAPPEARSI